MTPLTDPIDFVFFRPVETAPTLLAVEPRLESWDAASHPSQVALNAYLNHVREVVSPALSSPGPLAVDLHVHAAEGVALTSGGRDLDNFLFPVVRALGPSRFVSARASKGRGGSSISVGAAAACDKPNAGWGSAVVATTASAQTIAWKAQIADQVATQAEPMAPDGAAELEVAYVVSSRRNWASLWKPTIDALGHVLGVENPSRPFTPRDDRITNLGLHRLVDDTVGHSVRIGIWWRSDSTNGEQTPVGPHPQNQPV